jgi:hypothetical protein
MQKLKKMKFDIQLNFSPILSDLKEIENWLFDEEKNFSEGFYCNWLIIENAFQKNKLITINNLGLPIGFLVWSDMDEYVEFDILEIKPDYRNKGVGEKFLKLISSYLLDKNYLAIKLFCAPIKSENFWKKMNFIKFPDRGYSESKLSYFKPLVKIEKPSENLDYLDKLELWNVEPHQKDNYEPEWTWKLELNSDKLLFPIIHPYNPNWNLKWTKNGKIIKEDKIKYFTRKQEIEYEPFLIIKELYE